MTLFAKFNIDERLPKHTGTYMVRYKKPDGTAVTRSIFFKSDENAFSMKNGRKECEIQSWFLYIDAPTDLIDQFIQENTQAC